MLLAEGTFKGNTRRTKSLFLKYFDRFSILFNAVTDEFKTSYAAHPPASDLLVGLMSLLNAIAFKVMGGAYKDELTLTSQEDWQVMTLFLRRRFLFKYSRHQLPLLLGVSTQLSSLRQN